MRHSHIICTLYCTFLYINSFGCKTFLPLKISSTSIWKKTLIYVSTFPVIHFSIWIYNYCICYCYRLAILIAGMTTGMAFRHTLNKLACTTLPKSTPTRCLSTSLYLSARFNLFSKVKIMSINWDSVKFYSWKMYRSFS